MAEEVKVELEAVKVEEAEGVEKVENIEVEDVEVEKAQVEEAEGLEVVGRGGSWIRGGKGSRVGKVMRPHLLAKTVGMHWLVSRLV